MNVKRAARTIMRQTCRAGVNLADDLVPLLHPPTITDALNDLRRQVDNCVVRSRSGRPSLGVSLQGPGLRRLRLLLGLRGGAAGIVEVAQALGV
jgi:hypothetical protein